jgi:hypothetical protein
LEAMPSRFTSCSITATLAFALAGCSSTALSPSSTAEPSKPTVAQVQGNTPLPPGSVIKQDKSFIIGTGDNWFGRMTLNIGRDADIAYRFFVQQYPNQGWTLVSSVRTARSLLIFTKGDRSLTIEITEGNYLTPGEAILTVSPLSKPSPMGMPGGGAANITPLR